MKKKAAARFFGMKGGRFAEDGAGALIFELHDARLREIRKGPKSDRNDKGGDQWPQASIDEWRRIAAAANERPEGVSPSPRELMAFDVVAAADDGGWT